MLRTITAFRADDDGDWVAELSCLHGQHVRHRPPFREAAWVVDDAQRSGRIGTPLDCPLCDRAELPDGLRVVRTTPTWDEVTAPAALRRSHRVAGGVWGVLHVEAGELRFTADTTPPVDAVVDKGASQPIPPDVGHRVVFAGAVRFHLEFLSR